jgi:hypothetical protein
MIRTTAHKAFSGVLLLLLLLKVGSVSSLVLGLNLPFAFVLVELENFFCTTWALEPPSLPRARVSFALAFSSTSRVPIRLATVNSYLLCFIEVAKFPQEGGSWQ